MEGRGEMRNDFEVLIDSDAFVGRFYPNDALHARAEAIFANLEKRESLLVTTNLVIAETATVLSHRSGQPLARKFLEVIEEINLPVIHVDEELQQEATEVFKEQNKKGTSMTDCANAVVAKRFNISLIFSFDEVYPKKFGLKAAGSASPNNSL
jgi:predicted nucleic acid-binding protein